MDGYFSSRYLKDVLHRFRQIKSLAERAVAQVTDEELFTKIDEESNSVAILMKHMSGSMLHRWTDIWASEEERP